MQKRPNILFILTDQQRYDSLSCAGHPVVRTPHLDRLAAEGTRFRQAVCSWPVCGPARASMLTGLYPHGHRLYNNAKDKDAGADVPFAGDPNLPPLRPDVGTWDEALTAAGYASYYWGKWHTGDTHRTCYRNDTSEFRTYYRRALNAAIGEAAMYPGTERFWMSGRPYMPCAALTDAIARANAAGFRHSDCTFGRELISPDHTLTAFTVDKTLAALKEAAQADEPFALTCSIIYPHNPYIVAEPWYSMYPPESFSPPESVDDDLSTSPYAGALQTVRRFFPRDFSQGLGRFMSLYYGAVAEIDHHVGRLLQSLDELRLSDNTVVMFVSDHGELLGAHGRMGKADFFEESVRVPMIVRAPGGVAGQVSDAAVNQVDLIATILDYAGAGESLPTHGRSLRALVNGQPCAWSEFAFSEFENKPGVAAGELQGSRMVRSKEWKYIIRKDGREGLYDLTADPSEMTNLLAAVPDAVATAQCHRLQDALLDWMTQTNDPAREAFAAGWHHASKPARQDQVSRALN